MNSFANSVELIQAMTYKLKRYTIQNFEKLMYNFKMRETWNNTCASTTLKVSATLKIAIFPHLRFQRFQIDMLESFLSKKNQKKILFLSKDIGGKRFFLVNYLN